MYKWIYFTSRVLPLQFFTRFSTQDFGDPSGPWRGPEQNRARFNPSKMKHSNKVFRYFIWQNIQKKNSNQMVDPGTKLYPRTLMWKRLSTTAVEQHVPISLSLEILSDVFDHLQILLKKLHFSLEAKCSTVFTRRRLTMCPLLLWASSKFACFWFARNIVNESSECEPDQWSRGL